MLTARAELLAQIRKFFATRNVLEVETPVLAAATASDLHVQSWKTENTWGQNNQALYLQTSPEYAMKRLLASGSGAIYQLAKAFRFEERSDRHNPEFTLLEWYQPGYSLSQLMDEVEALVHLVMQGTAQGTASLIDISRFSYRELFQQNLEIDPHKISTDDLELLAKREISLVAQGLSRTDYLQLILSQIIEPNMRGNWFLYDYPEDQAALAQVTTDNAGVKVAQRFELFCSGMEIANGYYELTDPVEQRRRFESDLDKRQKTNRALVPIDENLIAALESGLPDCAGVALGVDRLLMIATGTKFISEVISFTTDLA
ncbi:MAG: lysyl-tRNA synthetase class 2 [Pseudohongiellaceae bacterium]|jgi:lysyl-tRNA synthetase class 2